MTLRPWFHPKPIESVTHAFGTWPNRINITPLVRRLVPGDGGQPFSVARGWCGCSGVVAR